MTTKPDMQPGQRVEVFWHRGEAGVWYGGTLLEGGRVELDDYTDYVIEPPFILEVEEIAAIRLAS